MSTPVPTSAPPEGTLRIQTPRVFLPLLEPARYKCAFGGRGCVHPDTVLDTPKGPIRIRDFTGGEIYSWWEGHRVVAWAMPPEPFTVEDLYEVTLEDGCQIIVTDEHKFLTDSGWKDLSSGLCDSDSIFVLRKELRRDHPQTTSGNAPRGSRGGVLHYLRTLASCLDGCFRGFRQCGQRLLSAGGIDQVSLRSLGDERQRNCHVSTHTGAPEFGSSDTLSRFSHRQTNRHALPSVGVPGCVDSGMNSAGRPFAQLLASFRGFLLSLWNSIRPVLAPALAGPYLAFYTSPGQERSHQTPFGTPNGNALGNSYHTSLFGDDFTLARISKICNHSRQTYWDLHVLGTNTYLSNGIVNHNSGKSWFFASLLIERCLMQKTDAVCLREVQKSLRFSVKKLLEMTIAQMGVQHRFDVQDKLIKSDLGGVIVFEGLQSHTADSIKSFESFDIFWVEEAQSLSFKSLEILRPTMRKKGGEMWFSYNPRYPTDAVDTFFRGANTPPSCVVVQANYTDNPWFDDSELRQDMEYDRERDPDKYRHVWLGDYEIHSEARILKSWTVEEFERPPGTIFRFGVDWGYAQDPTVLLRGSVEGNRLYIDYEAYMRRCEIVNLPGLFRQVPESNKWWITADSARPEVISHMRANGYPKINSSRKGKGSIKEGIEFLNSFDVIIHPRCKHTIDDFTSYKYKIDPDTDQVTNHIVDKNADCPDAARYLVEGLKRTRRGRHYGENVEESQNPVYDDAEAAAIRRHNSQGWMSW